MFSKLPASLLAFVLLGDFSCALRLNFEARRIPAERRGLYRRGSLSGSSPLDDSADLQYTTNITVGGVSFDVMIDTGSSDLWVAGSVSSASDTGKAATISYASGGATGPVKLGSVDFAGYTVPKQAFIEVPPDDAHPAGQGLIGLGPSVGSVIYDEFDAADEGNTVLDSIFIQNTATPNFITFALGRLNDPTDFFTGDFTVGEILTNFTDVSNQPKLPVTNVAISNQGNQHFQVLLDANGFIGPDGNAIPVTSEVSSTSNRKQATVVVDTGFSLPQVPRQVSVAKAIYGSFQDAELVNDPSIGQIWTLPCTQEVNITLKFGGKAYPVHPLDAAIDPSTFNLDARQTPGGKKACLGLFQPVSFDTGKNPTYDIIFGMAFLRNVYTLINFGDFIADSTNKADPYIQFLSITDPAEAHSDFVKVRLNGIDNQPSVLSHTGSTDNDNDSSSSPSKKTYIIIGAAVLGAIVLLLIGAFIFKRSRSKQRGVYRPLHLPAPGAGQPQMYQQQPLYGGANPPVYNADRPYDPPQEHVPYHNPWEGRRH
ncbi:aspartic peptidase domain-containing protein [Mycena albidolilacea]|uniref:Aspartic peptidase domain-containing protein n=1 Tax=Mycena albidolilacea TaxID=1033008 RepID=A0AAD7ASW9_9AGAR|nr:aspartic peptidase domain-containing protein [Mycena albidolilacea]